MPLAFIGLGANLPSNTGAPAATLTAALRHISAMGRLVARSSLYSTAPVGYADQPRFINAVIEIDTPLGPRKLLESLLAIERAFGRDRANAIPNGPRTLDLDILLYDDSIVNEADLQIPHPRLFERGFVLIPLNEIAPDARDPRSGSTVKELLQQLLSGPSLASNRTADEIVAIESDGWRAGVAYADDGGDRVRSIGNHDPHSD
ncbi:MAG TPA: 2-amino-4-hydroxy-6-hydroxymethyldihydropteridine diphosphokinase [Terracidiphilus sp.]|nr:2-amino-4-hydroxy-6-hydroxymethyldihydropteridine diphosphokinase [Terracidiphilus sp.]